MIDITNIDDPNSQPFDKVVFKVKWLPETLRQRPNPMNMTRTDREPVIGVSVASKEADEKEPMMQPD